jgi:predicted DNA-binding WGR domain protein
MEELSAFHKRQTGVKNQSQVNEFRNEQEQAQRAQALLDNQSKNFYTYAEKCIKDW